MSVHLKKFAPCCIYHVELDEFWLGLNNRRVKFGLHHNVECECRCSFTCHHASQSTCGVSSKVYKGIIEMWQMIICEKKEEEEWHKKQCL